MAKIAYGSALASLRGVAEASTKERLIESLRLFSATMGSFGMGQVILSISGRRSHLLVYGAIKIAAVVGAVAWQMKIEHFS